jgi:hypothetical protein
MDACWVGANQGAGIPAHLLGHLVPTTPLKAAADPPSKQARTHLGHLMPTTPLKAGPVCMPILMRRLKSRVEAMSATCTP